MDRLSSWMVRISLIWLFAGMSAGAAMMSDGFLRGHWRVWMGPTHGHMLFAGWFLQFATGIAFWLLPRSRTLSRPLGYRERRSMIAVAALNFGLILRVIAEPAQRSGHMGDWIDITLTASALFQVASIGVLIVELWPRVSPRAPRRVHPQLARETAGSPNDEQ